MQFNSIRNNLFKIMLISIGYFSIHPICKANESSWHFKSNDVNVLHSQPADYRLFYGKDSLQFGDLYLPKNRNKPYPIAIIIHGGCWVTHFADLKNTAALSDALRNLGIATWNIEYRRIDNKRGGWPGTFQDVALAADFLKNIAKKYDLDLNKVIVIGHSAGGHLALWLAGRHNLTKNNVLYVENPLKIKSVISMGGVPDLKAFQEHCSVICKSDNVGKLIDNNPANYKQASPIELLPLGIPQTFIYGEDDIAVPALFAQQYIQIAKAKGDKIELIKIKFAGHHEYIVPNSVVWPAIAKKITNNM